MMKSIQTDDENNLVTRVAYNVITVQLQIKAEQIITIFKLEGAHIPTNLSSKNVFRLTRRDVRNGTH
jgi:hypothetical protein